MNMLSAKRTAPPYFLLLFLLGFLAMFAASVHAFLNAPDSAKPDMPAAAAKSGPEPKSGTNPPEAAGSALSEQQAEDMTALMRKIQGNPNDAEALMAIGETFLLAKEWSRAEVFLGRAVMSKPSAARPRSLLGVCLYQQGKMQEAARTFEEALEMENDPAALYNLAVIYKYHLDKTGEAKTLLERILASPEADADALARAKKELSQ